MRVVYQQVKKPYSISQTPNLFVSETLEKLRKVVWAGTSLMIIWLLVNPQLCVNTLGQTQTDFTTADKFSIPQYNSTISFALNGSYSAATLENGFWTFKNLKLDLQDLSFLGLNATHGLNELRISAQNSNVTVWARISVIYSFPVDLISYYAEGKGNQTVNLGLNASRSSSDEWSVIVSDNVFLPLGDDWSLLPDDSVVVWGRTGNVTVAHFGFNAEYRSLSFLLGHYVGIFTALLLVAVIFVAVIIRIRVKKSKKPLKHFFVSQQVNRFLSMQAQG
jgi:hypothetical protein